MDCALLIIIIIQPSASSTSPGLALRRRGANDVHYINILLCVTGNVENWVMSKLTMRFG